MTWMTSRRGGTGTAVAALVLTAGLAGCSSTGGAQEDTGGEGAEGGGGTQAGIEVAMITHGPAGDTFWDTIRAGAEAAAGNVGVELQYTSDGDVTAQANLIQSAIDSEVDALAVSVPDADALGASIQAATDAGIPVVMFNAGFNDWEDLGAIAYYGQEETVAGNAIGERLAGEGATKVLCVIQAQGQSQLEARCDGITQGLGSEVERLYVDGTDLAATTATIGSKLQQDTAVSHVITLGAPIALAAVQSKEDSGSAATIGTFDTSADLVGAIEDGSVAFAVDQQPYAQGYMAVTQLALDATTGVVLGGGEPVFTGPAFIDESNVAEVAEFAADGVR